MVEVKNEDDGPVGACLGRRTWRPAPSAPCAKRGSGARRAPPARLRAVHAARRHSSRRHSLLVHRFACIVLSDLRSVVLSDLRSREMIPCIVRGARRVLNRVPEPPLSGTCVLL